MLVYLLQIWYKLMFNGFVAFVEKTLTIVSLKKSGLDAFTKTASVVFLETNRLVPKVFVKLGP